MAVLVSRNEESGGIRSCFVTNAVHNSAQYTRRVRDDTAAEFPTALHGAQIDPGLSGAARESPHNPREDPERREHNPGGTTDTV